MSPRSYVVYAPVTWDGARQATHGLAEALARRHRVLWVDPPISPLTPVRYGLGRDSAGQARALVSRRPRRAGDVQVFAPLTLPPVEHPRARRVSLPFVRAQVAAAVGHAGLREPVVLGWRGLAQLAGVAGERMRVGFVMDHPSAGAALMGRDPAELEAETWETCAAADLLCTTSQPMLELLGEHGWSSELVRFGFPADLAETFDSAAVPAEYASLPRPLLGYAGGVDDRLDFELIQALADRFPEASLVFVGPLSPRLSEHARGALRSRPNIHLLGARTREQLPAYTRHLDVALMPYRDSLWIRHASPLKLWEYLYAGPPIVGTGTPELKLFPPPLVGYADSHSEALELVSRALEDADEGRSARRSLALENTWEHRARQLDELVARRLEGPGAADAPATAPAAMTAIGARA